MFRKMFVMFLAVCLIFIFLSSEIFAEQGESEKEIIISKTDIDIPYSIIKIVSPISASPEENLAQIKDSVSHLKGDAAIFLSQWSLGPDFTLPMKDSAGNAIEKPALCTDAIIVKFLDSEALAKRAKDAKKPPAVKKKESPLDPDPTIVQTGNVKYPYKVLGVVNLKTRMFENPGPTKAANGHLASLGYNAGADAVIFVEYLGEDPFIAGARGIMIKFLDKWPKVDEKNIGEKP